MIVPSDMWHLLQSGSGHLLLCHQPKKRTGTRKVPSFFPVVIHRPLFSG